MGLLRKAGRSFAAVFDPKNDFLARIYSSQNYFQHVPVLDEDSFTTFLATVAPLLDRVHNNGRVPESVVVRLQKAIIAFGRNPGEMCCSSSEARSRATF